MIKRQTHDQIQAAARLILRYNAQVNAFYGTIQNITSTVLRCVYVEIYLSDGAELETAVVDLATGKSANLLLPATEQPFDTWRAHADREDDRDDDRD